jgi:hypothetical protein
MASTINKKGGDFLYATTFDDYVQAFKQTMSLYYYFTKGGPLGQGHYRTELLLCKTTQSNDLK